MSTAETSAIPIAPEPGLLAAVDLGSNSFHLLVAQVTGGQLQVIDRLREPVQLAAGLDDGKLLSREATDRALECLGRFGQRVRGMGAGSVRAVGTNTLRIARNGDEFRRAAERALGHRIEVIAGREEARLIYLGVAHAVAGDTRRRLVVDIGGGSTEFIIGEGFSPVFRESLYMGCVSMSQRFFPDGRIDKASMRRAELAARIEIEPIESHFRAASWEAVVGASGTIRAVEAIVRAAGWCDDGITRGALRKLRRALVDAGHVNDIKLKEVKDDRRSVLPGGVAVLCAAFEGLGIERASVSDMALREGLLYDLLGRIRHEDVRDATVRTLGDRYGVDTEQAARVERTALACLRQVAAPWGLDAEEHRLALGWSAKLHEIGLAVSHNQYHKHGAYLLENADMAGFSRQEQAVLAALVRGHRRKFPAAVFEALPAPESARRLCVLLRLSVMLHRSRSGSRLPRFDLTPAETALGLDFPPGWLDHHPLTRTDLAQEAEFLQAAKFELVFR